MIYLLDYYDISVVVIIITRTIIIVISMVIVQCDDKFWHLLWVMWFQHMLVYTTYRF